MGNAIGNYIHVSLCYEKAFQGNNMPFEIASI